MKKENRASLKMRFPAPEKFHISVIRAFLVHYCEGFSWSLKAQGMLRARDWKALLYLAKEVQESYLSAPTFYDDKNHTEYGSAAKFLAASQFVALVLKYPYDKGVIAGVDPEQTAKDDFLAAERRNRRLNSIFDAHRARGTERHWCIDSIRNTFRRVLGDTPFYGEILRKSDFSGGASVSFHGSKTHLARKLASSKICGTEPVMTYFIEAIWKNHQYRRLFTDGYDICYDTDFDKISSAVTSLWESVNYNIITVVPKTALSGRTIAMEPEANNFLQKGIDLEIRALLKRVLNIDLSSQEVNALMSKEGSIEENDPYVTIDVRGASNSVLRALVQSVAPPRWFKLLDHSRSPCYTLDGETTPYEMFCSMGNGFCFPLETLLFASICIAAYRHCGQTPDYRCYGDDIIVRQSVALVVIECLKACGFRVNTSKTFIHGRFRESCGANWYGGQDVTPGYFKTQITDYCTAHAVHNSLHRWPELQAAIRALVPSVKYVISTEEARGQKPSDPPWVTNQAFIVEQDYAMSIRGVVWLRHNQTWSYPILRTQPVPDEDWVSTLRTPNEWCADQLRFTAVLRGSQNSREPFHLRHTERHYPSATLVEPTAAQAARVHAAIMTAWNEGPKLPTAA